LNLHVNSELRSRSLTGLSATWFLLFFDESATLTCVDPFVGDVHDVRDDGRRLERFFANVAFAGRARVRVRRGLSGSALFGLAAGSFDVAYVDGSHTAPDALSDMVMAFQ
jgi:predicted O-methyltransferase YrrM